MASILVAGTDLVGKTTLISNLESFLSKEGYNVRVNKFDLFKTPINRFAHKMMDDSWHKKKRLINSFLAFSFVLDSLLYKPRDDEILIQDSYVNRTISFCRAYEIPHVADYLQGIKSSLYSFDVNILLSSNIEAKRQRLIRRGKADIYDKDIFRRPQIYETMDHVLKGLASKESSFIEIDTSSSDKDYTLKCAVEHLGDLL